MCLMASQEKITDARRLIAIRGEDRPQKPVLFTKESHKIPPKAQEIHSTLTFYRCCHKANGHLGFCAHVFPMSISYAGIFGHLNK